jgi:hypothetical protein
MSASSSNTTPTGTMTIQDCMQRQDTDIPNSSVLSYNDNNDDDGDDEHMTSTSQRSDPAPQF